MALSVFPSEDTACLSIGAKPGVPVDDVNLISDFIKDDLASRKGFFAVKKIIIDSTQCTSETVTLDLAESNSCAFAIAVCLEQSSTGYSCSMRLLSVSESRIIATTDRKQVAGIVKLSGMVPSMVNEIVSILKEPKRKTQTESADTSSGLSPSQSHSLSQTSSRATIPDKSPAGEFSGASSALMELMRAGDAYFGRGDYPNAESTYRELIGKVASASAGASELSLRACAFCRLGDIDRQEFRSIKLEGKNEHDVKKLISVKTNALEKTLKDYGGTIGTGVRDRVCEAVHKIGLCFVDMAYAMEHRSLFGTLDEQISARISIESNLDKYYEKAQEKFVWIIRKSREQNFSNSYVVASEDMSAKVAYMRGMLFEKVGEIFLSAPVPKDLSPEEQQAYRDLLNEKRLAARDAAEKKYEESMKTLSGLGVHQCQWIDSLRARIQEINPGSATRTMQFEPGR